MKESSPEMTFTSSKQTSRLSPGIIKPAAFAVDHQTSPVVSSSSSPLIASVTKPTSLLFPSNTTSFPVAPLFNGLSQNIKFADSMRRSADPPTNGFQLKQSAFGVLPKSLLESEPNLDTDATINNAFPVAPLFSSLSRGIKFSHREEHAVDRDESIVKLCNSDINETTILDNSDVCMIFGKKSEASKQSHISSSSFLKPTTLSIGAEGGAFRPVKAPPITEPMPGDEVALNTEVEVYSKIGKLYKDKLDQADSKRKANRLSGAFNIVAKLLLHGDSKV